MTGAQEPALRVRNLSVRLGGAPLVDGVSFDVAPGECVAIVGESGAGKSLTAAALLGLTPSGARVESDELRIAGRDARGASERSWRRFRGDTIALVSQDALVSLDPLRTVGAEVAEPLAIHTRLSRAGRSARVVDLLADVAVPDPARRARQRPHELSGGLRQRALIASALAADPRVLVADEPTTALDATVQARVLGLLRHLADSGRAIVFISHDFAAVERVADRVLVLSGGRVIERGEVAAVMRDPQHDQTRALVAASRHRPRPSVPSGADAEVVVSAVGASKSYGGVPAVLDVHLRVVRGRTLGLVGESGSGKTTLARMIVGAESADTGLIRVADESVSGGGRPQLVHQNPRGALDPRWSVGRSIREALEAAGVPRAHRAGRARRLLAEVGLGPDLARRRPSALSGGQRQRVAIARALAADPRILVLDEPVSALDPTVRERVLELLRRLQRERALTMVFVSHDLDVVAAVADDVAVMQRGRIVEQGTVAQVFAAPQHPFTRELLAASSAHGERKDLSP
ncbi:ATP-binding cassette domain-containing protein [Microbacterium resistens]|uniref:ATP-binding cassette domain-containing protein n=1 Tax=Microbacterium resistens TaxID=156977 RepID=UPI0008371316|nr:ABC transporter ATP-binding protein [Microbacterium resistens]